MDVVLPNDSFM